jgi:hypothetical protein
LPCRASARHFPFACWSRETGPVTERLRVREIDDDEAARVIAASADPGRMGRTAHHLIHPVMVAGIIVAAAADEVMVSGPGVTGVAWKASLVLGRYCPVHRRSCHLQDRRVAGGAVVAAGRGGSAGAAGPGSAIRVAARAGSVRDGRGDCRRGSRPLPGRPPGSARAGIGISARVGGL